MEAAKECNIKYISYISIAQIVKPKFGLEINHSQIEQWIKESGIQHKFLRNSWYIDLDESVYLNLQKNRSLYLYIADEGVASYAIRREYTEAGAKVILSDNNPEILTLARKAIIYPELAKYIEKALCKKIEVKKVTLEEFEKYLVYVEATQLGKLASMNIQKYTKEGNNGEELNNPSDFEKVLGHPLESYENTIKEYISN